METHIRVLVSYRARSYFDADVADLADALSVLGPVTIDPQQLPEAGGTWELSVILHTLLEGIAAAAAYDVLKELARLTVNWVQRRRKSDFEPDVRTLGVHTVGGSLELTTSEGDQGMDLSRTKALSTSIQSLIPPTVIMAHDIRVVVVRIPPEGSDDVVRWLVGKGTNNLTHEYDPERKHLTPLTDANDKGVRDA